MSQAADPEYLKPYLRAAARHGGGFRSLLWASTLTQARRFDALARACDFAGKSVLDAGCGRADLLDFLIDRRIEPDRYVGLEAVAELADEAEKKGRGQCLIVRTDFVHDPEQLYAGAEVIAFSGSLNTLDDAAFYSTLQHAFQAAAGPVVFNFLSSPLLAGTNYLRWRRPATVLKFVRDLGGDARKIDDYIDGDCTICVRKMDRSS